MSRSNAVSPEVILRLRAAGIPMPGDDLDTQPDITINVLWHGRNHREPANQWLRQLLFEMFAI